MNILEKMKKIKAFIFDVDGVFSHNIYINSSGEQWRSMNTKDGYAIQYAIKKNYLIAIVSGAYCEGIKIRFNGLGVKDVYLQVPSKITAVDDFIKKHNLSYDELLYMGDDLPDYEPMIKAGIAACPNDAVIEIKQISGFISSYKGGEGCVREIIEKVLKIQNNWFDKDSFEW